MSMYTTPDKGYLGNPPIRPTYETMVFDNKAYRIHTVVAYKFRMGDVEDPDLYAAQPIWEWQQTDPGKWIMEKAVEPPTWHRHAEPMTYGYQFAITAKLKDIDYTFWTLKWADTVDKKS